MARAVYEGRASFGEDRGTASAHYKRFAKAGVPGYSLEKAEQPPEDDLDEEFAHLLVWYADIRNRQSRGMQYEPVSLEAIEVYERSFLGKLGIEMTAFDWDMIFRIDAEYTAAIPKTPEEQRAAEARRQRKPH